VLLQRLRLTRVAVDRVKEHAWSPQRKHGVGCRRLPCQPGQSDGEKRQLLIDRLPEKAGHISVQCAVTYQVKDGDVRHVLPPWCADCCGCAGTIAETALGRKKKWYPRQDSNLR